MENRGWKDFLYTTLGIPSTKMSTNVTAFVKKSTNVPAFVKKSTIDFR